MIWQNTGNILEERFSNEGCTLERRKNIGNPTPRYKYHKYLQWIKYG